MSELLQQLNASSAFAPSMGMVKLAEAHIPFAELTGYDLEGRIAEAIEVADGLVLLEGERGAGKSSALAKVALDLSKQRTPNGECQYFPLFVPIVAADRVDIQGVGKQAWDQLAYSLQDLPEPAQEGASEQIGRAKVEQVSRQLPAQAFNAKLSASVLGTGLELGGELKGGVVTLTQSSTPLDELGGLLTLAETLRGNSLELVLIIEDTDGWSLETKERGLKLAQTFFARTLRPLLAPGFAFVVAVQSHWRVDAEAYEPIADQAPHLTRIPEFPGDRALDAVKTVLARRCEYALGTEHSAEDIATDDALDLLAAKLLETQNIRDLLTMMRDALMKAEPDVERITRAHLLEGA